VFSLNVSTLIRHILDLPKAQAVLLDAACVIHFTYWMGNFLRNTARNSEAFQLANAFFAWTRERLSGADMLASAAQAAAQAAAQTGGTWRNNNNNSNNNNSVNNDENNFRLSIDDDSQGGNTPLYPRKIINKMNYES